MTQLSKPSSRSTSSLLHRILSAPDLVRQIQSLPAPALLQIIRRIGLEDCTELLALASGEQLARLVDEDLWVKTGNKEQFDTRRFSTWLLVLEEMGHSRAGQKLSELDEDFLSLAFSHYFYVLELDSVNFLRVRVQGDQWEDERLEKILGGFHQLEIGEYLVLGKPSAPWESLEPLLLALDEADSRLLGRVLHRLAIAGEAKADREGGLFEVLSSEEMLEGDASFAREQRRTRDGFVAHSDAVAFLEWVRATPTETILSGPDPVSTAYFREYEGLVLGAAPDRSTPPLFQELLEEEIEGQPLRLAGAISPLAAYLSSLPQEESRRFLMELNFLSQVLMQTETLRGGPLRPGEAADRVSKCCEAGLTKAGGKNLSAVQLFALGR